VCKDVLSDLRVGLDDPQRSLPTPTILWFCGSVTWDTGLLCFLTTSQWKVDMDSSLPGRWLLCS